MLDEMRALVALDEAGSFVRAADKLCLTPSAATRLVQRLESHLDATLLDRTVKPPRFTPLGRSVLQQCRDVLARVDEISASVNADAEPSGVFRLGLSHALADESIVQPVQGMAARFPALKLRIWGDLTSRLLDRLRGGELDAALVLTPLGHQPPPPLIVHEVANDTMTIAAASGDRLAGRASLSQLGGRSWVLNPAGCLLRAALIRALEDTGIQPDIVAEVQNLHLQASMVAQGLGLGLLPSRHIRSRKGSLKAVRPPGLELPMTVCFVQAGHLGRQESAARYLGGVLRDAWVAGT